MGTPKDLNAKEGMRIRLVNMVDDPNPIAPGTEGTIRLVDGQGIIHVNWDDGRTLGLIPGVDHYQLVYDTNSDVYDETDKMFESTSIKPTKISQSVSSGMKSRGVKNPGGQVKKSFTGIKEDDIKDLKKNQIKGGKADKKTLKDLAKKHKVTLDAIKKEVKLGIKIEKEHVGNDLKKAQEIAMDHVYEFSDFYTNKRYGAIASEKGLKKNSKKSKIDYMSAGGMSGGNTTGTAWGPSGAGITPPTTGTGKPTWGDGPLSKKGVAKPGPLKKDKIQEITATYHWSGNQDDDIITKNHTDSHQLDWAQKDSDGWKWNDNPLWEGGEIVDPLAKIDTTWDDDNMDVSKEWDKSQKKKSSTKKSLKKEDVVRMVQSRFNEHRIVNDKNIDKIKDNFKPPVDDEDELTEDTTFASVWGSNGPPVGPAFAAKQGQWTAGKKPIWKGGKIVQQVENSGVLNPITESNPIKYNPKGSFVKIKKKCTKFPYCNQGAIDNPISLSNSSKGNGSYVEENVLSDSTIKNIYEFCKETGKPFTEVYKIVKEQMKLR